MSCVNTYKEKLLSKIVLDNAENFINSLPAPLRQSVWVMVQCANTHVMEKKAIGAFIELLTEDTSLTNIIPYKYLYKTKQLLTEILELSNGEISNKIDSYVHSTKFFCPELGDLLLISSRLSSNKKPREYIIQFLDFIIKEAEKINNNNISPEDIQQLKKYNPPKEGKAYYFNKSGDQLRSPRLFEIDRKKTSKRDNFDDDPDKLCSKSFPMVSKRGTTYLFLWFCPAHGHCYGFHIIPGSEGRKDAANSLYCYLEKAPETIFYDFACSLDEYCKNRETGYFGNTRFFHDIFHGYTHKCSKIFKSNRLLGYDGINTSICEQFNSFLQCIKASCKLMTQEHFTFYVQFFIHQWNIARKRSSKTLNVNKY